MTTLNIDSSITSSEIESVQLITSNNHHTYNFVNASICIEINVDQETYTATLQNGHSYYNNDYSLPSNALSVYEGSELLEQLNSLCLNDLDDNKQVEYINELCETVYTKEQLAEIYTELAKITGEAENIIMDAEAEADEALENDNHIYVAVIEYIIDDTKKQCCGQYAISFDDKESAENFIIENCDELTNAYIIDKEIAVPMIQAQQ